MITNKANGVIHSQKGQTYYSLEFKQRLVAAARQPGVSLSSIAREQGVSISALSKWCQQYQQKQEPLDLLPIVAEVDASLTSDIEVEASVAAPLTLAAAPSGSIDITLQQASIRVNGLVDANTLRVVLEGLQRC